MISERAVLGRVKRGELELPPMRFSIRRLAPKADSPFDLILEGTFAGQSYRFAGEIRTLATPKVFAEALARARTAPLPPKTLPLLIVPYLSEERLKELQEAGVSGVDLSGNGVMIVPDRLLVFRTGQPNLFPKSDRIRNVYDGKSSIVARAFLLGPRYPTVTKLAGSIMETARVSLPTISKSLFQLEQDLMIARDADGLRLIQPEKLMDALADNYRPPELMVRLVGKATVSETTLLQGVTKAASRRKERLVLTGASSVGRYAVIGRESMFSFYCESDPAALLKDLNASIEVDSPFPNLELLQTEDERVYFDCQDTRDNRVFASRIQTWLELQKGDKRDQEAAAEVRASILRDIQSKLASKRN